MDILKLVDKKINDIRISRGLSKGISVKKVNVDIWNIPTERRVCGVYIIVTRRCIYIGSSIDIWNRLRNVITGGNLCKKNMEEIIGAVVYIVDNEYNARFLERILLDSDLNIVKRVGVRHGKKETGINGSRIEKTGIWRVSVWKRYKRLKII